MTSLNDFAMFKQFEKEAAVCYEVLNEAAQKSIEFKKELDASMCFRKEDGSPVTIFDHVLQAIIMQKIIKEFPEEPILAEEYLDDDIEPSFLEKVMSYVPKDIDIKEIFKHVKQVAPLKAKRYWVIDPIDETVGFTKPDGHYAIAIAVVAFSLHCHGQMHLHFTQGDQALRLCFVWYEILELS